jgi:methyl-galactoside transport system substrate-binding protein
MKKFIAIILSLCMLLVFVAACAPSDDGDGSIRVDVFWYTFADTFLASVRNAMESQLAQYDNLNVTQHDCNEDQSRQTDMIRTAITQGTDVLVVNIVTTGSEETAMAIVDMARDANLPIIFFNREVSDAVINSYDKAVFVGTDADEAGIMQGEAVANFLLQGDNISRFDLNGDGEIRYVMLRGEHGNAEAWGRTFYSVTKANEMLAGAGVRLVPSVANETSTQYQDDGISNFFLMANWSATTAFELMSTAMAAHSLEDGSIELILANNDDAALGAINALNEFGFNTGAADAPMIPIFGVDATDVAVEAINAGRMTGTILQDGPEMARVITMLLNNVAAGNDLMAGTSGMNIDSGVAKIRIPYAIVA